MGLVLTLRPNEKIFVNGCILRNSDRKAVLTVESRADVLRESAFLKAGEVEGPFRRVYFLIQAALLDPAAREGLNVEIQSGLAELAATGDAGAAMRAMEAVRHVAQGQMYRALFALCPDFRGPVAAGHGAREGAGRSAGGDRPQRMIAAE